MFYEHHPEYKELLDDLYVYIDSPMATTATEVFRKNAQVFDEETKQLILSGDNPLDFKNLIFTRSTAESQALNMNREPKIIISASGMCEAGRIRHHLKHNLWDSRNSIVFVGYQAEGTLGRALIDGVKEVKLFGETIMVAAEIHNLEGFSGHADQNGLLDWLGGFQKIPKQIFLVHGEEQSKIDFAKVVQERLGLSTTPIFANSEFELETGELIAQDQVIKEVIDEEGLTNLRSKITDIQKGVDNILAQTDSALSKEMTADKLTQINNILQELEKVSLNLGSTVTKG
jgi:metallo-beta-lactamase family protein